MSWQCAKCLAVTGGPPCRWCKGMIAYNPLREMGATEDQSLVALTQRCMQEPGKQCLHAQCTLHANTLATAALTAAVLELGEGMRDIGVHLNTLYNLVKSRVGS